MKEKIESTEPKFALNEQVVCAINGTPTMGYIRVIDIHLTRSHDVVVWYEVGVGRKRIKVKENELNKLF